VAEELGVVDRVTFRGSVPREEVLDLLRNDAEVLLFPSIHEGCGWIVGEALTLGVPAVCIDRGDPPSLGATVVPLQDVTSTAVSLAEAVREDPPGSLTRWDIDSRQAELRRLLLRRRLLTHARS